MNELEAEVYRALEAVADPEIPSVNVLDLGMIERIEVKEGVVAINVLPTFMGCPALDIIKGNLEQAVLQIPGITKATVQFIADPPWTSNRITARGRERLKEYGIAPPPEQLNEQGLWEVDCPYCGSTYTTVENLFGPTACRSILYCKGCRNPFEAMKPLGTM